MKNPPFEITQAMLTDAAEIAEMVGRLSAGKLSSSPILRRTNRIRTIQGTLAIEQNTLSVEQVTAATPLFSPACWEPGFQAWAQSPCLLPYLCTSLPK